MNGHGPAALTGIRVLDFTEGVSGPYCTKLLADLGADVVKVERPETGEIARNMPPFAGGEPGPERSLLFHYLNTNKRSLVLDLTATGPGEELQSLLSRADVVVENFAPGTMDRLGIGYQALSRVNPRLVLTSISNFGQTGPYRDLPASELVLSAMGGLMALSGSTSKEPIKHGLMQAHYGAGAVAAYATIAGVLQQEQSDAGCWIDVSVQEVVASELVLTEPLYAWAGGVQGRRPDLGDCLNNITECKDGHVVVQVTRAAMWSALVEMLKSEELADEKFATPTLRVANRAELDRALRDPLAHRTKREIFDLAAQHRVLAGMVQDPRDLLDCPQLKARGYFAEVAHPVTGPLRHPGAPVRLNGTPWELRRRAPLLGEHTAEICAEARLPPGSRPETGPMSPAPSAGPLAGLRVVDMSTVFAMPYLAAILADLGAEVIKVEAPHRLELARRNATFTVLPDNQGGGRPWDQSGTFCNVNRGKRSCTLNLTTEQGRDIFRDLVKISDVVVESYTPRVLRNWGLTYASLREIQPRLVMISNTGYGHDGPWSELPVQGTSLEPMTGISHFTGYAGGRPWKAGQSYPDLVVMWHGLPAVLAAIRHVRKTGEGQWLDLGMYQACVSTIGEAILDYQVNGELGGRVGNRDLAGSVQGCYETRDPDRWACVTASSDEQWAALARLLDPQAWAPGGPPQSLAQARARHDEVDAAVGRWMAARTLTEAVTDLRTSGLAVGPVADQRDLMLDEHLRARNFYKPVVHPAGVGRRLLITRPWISTSLGEKIQGPAPILGDANHYVLHDLLGFSGDAIARLEGQGVTGVPAPVSPGPPELPMEELLRGGMLQYIDPGYARRIEDAYPPQAQQDLEARVQTRDTPWPIRK